MLPLQEIEIRTKKNRLFHVHLEKWGDSFFKCKLIEINPDQFPMHTTFEQFSKGVTAVDAFKSFVYGLSKSLAKAVSEDLIIEINNPCNTEFITEVEQQLIMESDVVIKVNGKRGLTR